ncbi:MAG: DUF2782 domain-containing protein [Lamprocystis purpurea]|jgi:hypothetical protein|uniref:DUF2782 domain-containing protein n=1 Tax=Lamprocystis purpurea TaxID=61598 RepID=UPI00037357E8|nr:DUF2782 domain-containing protein [Lamprocystis purpurea]MBV5272623.1 DUF2782 domain-containing protein [Lamprocystis purpurea]
MKHRAAPILLLLALLLPAFGLPVFAQDPAPPAADGAGGFLQAPTVEPTPVAGDAVEPEITIRESGDETIYEYRVRGALYMVKIQPQFGPPYFLVDTDGDGTLDVRDSSPKNISIPQWVLFTWD